MSPLIGLEIIQKCIEQIHRSACLLLGRKFSEQIVS